MKKFDLVNDDTGTKFTAICETIEQEEGFSHKAEIEGLNITVELFYKNDNVEWDNYEYDAALQKLIEKVNEQFRSEGNENFNLKVVL